MSYTGDGQFFVELRQSGKSQVVISFKHESERAAFLAALNKKRQPWDLCINLWEGEME